MTSTYKLYFTWLILATLFLFQQCKPESKDTSTAKSGKKIEKKPDADVVSDNQLTPDPGPANQDIPDTNPVSITPEKEAGVQFSELTANNGVMIDLRYATKNNFTKQKIYDCARCYLRPEAAESVLKVQQELQEKFGYSLKLFDCFRPRSYQQRLWDIVPDADYVTPPSKGSMHSRGLAVDLTLVDEHGNELDMGTPFDFFGEEAHYSYNHPDAVKRNRWILKSTMEKYGFGGIRTEWWHFSYRKKSYPLDEWIWACK